MPGQIQELAEKDFTNAIKNKVSLVIFWAPWCHACHAMLPLVEDLVKSFNGKIMFYKTNVVDNPGLSSRYGVMSLPNILVFKKGKVLEQIIGTVSKTTLENSLKRRSRYKKTGSCRREGKEGKT